MKTFVFVIAAAFALSVPVAAQAATVPVQSLSGAFAATNSSVAKVAEGVQFGPYANGGTAVGSLFYSGANGLTLGQLTALAYSETHNTSDDNPVGTPYLRVFLDSNGDGVEDSDVIFSPNTQVPPQTNENVLLHHDVVAGTLRYNDDDGDGIVDGTENDPVPLPAEFGLVGAPFSVVRTAHATDVITGIYVTTGFSGGADLSAIQTDLTVNGTTFAFNLPPAPAPGTTTIIQVPGQPGAGVFGVQTRRNCRGATVRRIHAPQRRGERFLRVNAALQSARGLRALRTQGRTITVDLRNRPEANYNVRLISRYRTKSGKTRRVVTRRNLSVACS